MKIYHLFILCSTYLNLPHTGCVSHFCYPLPNKFSSRYLHYSMLNPLRKTFQSREGHQFTHFLSRFLIIKLTTWFFSKFAKYVNWSKFKLSVLVWNWKDQSYTWNTNRVLLTQYTNIKAEGYMRSQSCFVWKKMVVAQLSCRLNLPHSPLLSCFYFVCFSFIILERWKVPSPKAPKQRFP